jgi:Sec-independent protein translocase protein TatA
MSLSEILVVVLVALIAIGPKRLPEVAYGLGRLAQMCMTLRHNLMTEVNQQLQLKYNEAKAKAVEDAKIIEENSESKH